VIRFIDTLLKSWILGIQQRSIKGILSVNLKSKSTKESLLRYFITVSKEFSRKGEMLIGVLTIKIKRRFINQGSSEKKFGKYIINLGAFLRSTRSGVDVRSLHLLANLFSDRGIRDVIIPIYYIPELVDRLKPILREISDDLKELNKFEELEIINIDVKISSKKVNTTPSDILSSLMRIVISQYTDVSELDLLEREIEKTYGVLDDVVKNKIIERWRKSLKEILKIVANYSILLFKCDKFDQTSFLESLSKNLRPEKVKIALNKFLLLARKNLDEENYIEFIKEFSLALKNTTLQGLTSTFEFENDTLSNLNIKKYFKQNLRGFSSLIPQISKKIRLMGNLDKVIRTYIKDLFLLNNLSEDDKIIAAIIIVLLLKPSKLRLVLYDLRNYIICEACMGARIIDIIYKVITKPTRNHLREITNLLNHLIYSKELKKETYRLFLLISYLVKALVAKDLGLENISESCLYTANIIGSKIGLPTDRLARGLFYWSRTA